jgi:hypothetical protein
MVAIRHGSTRQRRPNRKQGRICVAELIVVNVESQVGLVVVNILKSRSKALPRKIVVKDMPMIQKNQVFSVEFLVRIKVKY